MKELRVKEQFIALRARGLSFDKIARRLRVSKPTLLQWSCELHEELEKAKLLEMDALLEQFKMYKAARVERLARMLRKIQKELDSRDFSELPTEKLIALEHEYSEKLLREADTVRLVTRVGGLPMLDMDLDGKPVVVSVD